MHPQITGNGTTDCNPPTKLCAKTGRNHSISTWSNKKNVSMPGISNSDSLKKSELLVLIVCATILNKLTKLTSISAHQNLPIICCQGLRQMRERR